MKCFDKFNAAVLSGIFIGIAATAFLNVGGIAGAVLFSFGLLAIIHYKIPLYTGTAGFVKTKSDILSLLIILFGNILGCAITAGFIAATGPDLSIQAYQIIQTHMCLGWWSQLILSFFCGIIMTTAVNFARDGKYLPLLFGVPVFILSGFIHSIADTFYLFLASIGSGFMGLTGPVMLFYLTIVIGNFIGCNLYKLFLKEDA